MSSEIVFPLTSDQARIFEVFDQSDDKDASGTLVPYEEQLQKGSGAFYKLGEEEEKELSERQATELAKVVSDSRREDAALYVIDPKATDFNAFRELFLRKLDAKWQAENKAPIDAYLTETVLPKVILHEKDNVDLGRRLAVFVIDDKEKVDLKWIEGQDAVEREKRLAQLIKSGTVLSPRNAEETQKIMAYVLSLQRHNSDYFPDDFYQANWSSVAANGHPQTQETLYVLSPQRSLANCHSNRVTYSKANGYRLIDQEFDKEEARAVNDFFVLFHDNDSSRYGRCANTSPQGEALLRKFEYELDVNLIPLMIAKITRALTIREQGVSPLVEESEDIHLQAALLLVDALPKDKIEQLNNNLVSYETEKEKGEPADLHYNPTWGQRLLKETSLAPILIGGLAIATVLGHGMVRAAEGISTWIRVKTKGFLKSFGTNLSHEVVEKLQTGEINPYIVGENENLIKELIALLEAPEEGVKNRSAILRARPGVGKTEMVKYLAFLAARNGVKQLSGFEFWHLHSDKLSGEGKLSGGARKVEWLVKEVKKARKKGRTIVVFIDEVHRIVDVDKNYTYDISDVAERFKEKKMSGELIILGGTTIDEYRRYISGIPGHAKYVGNVAFAERFRVLDLHEPAGDNLRNILEARRASIERGSRVAFEKGIDGQGMVDYLMEWAHLVEPDRAEPRRSIDLLSHYVDAQKAKHNPISLPNLEVSPGRALVPLAPGRAKVGKIRRAKSGQPATVKKTGEPLKIPVPEFLDFLERKLADRARTEYGVYDVRRITPENAGESREMWLQRAFRDLNMLRNSMNFEDFEPSDRLAPTFRSHPNRSARRRARRRGAGGSGGGGSPGNSAAVWKGEGTTRGGGKPSGGGAPKASAHYLTEGALALETGDPAQKYLLGMPDEVADPVADTVADAGEDGKTGKAIPFPDAQERATRAAGREARAPVTDSAEVIEFSNQQIGSEGRSLPGVIPGFRGIALEAGRDGAMAVGLELLWHATDMPHEARLPASLALIHGANKLAYAAGWLSHAPSWAMMGESFCSALPTGVLAGGLTHVGLNSLAEKFDLKTLNPGEWGNNLGTAVGSAIGGGLPFYLASRMPTLMGSRIFGLAMKGSGTLGGAMLAYGTVGKGIDLATEALGVEKNFAGRGVIQGGASLAAGHLVNRGITVAGRLATKGGSRLLSSAAAQVAKETLVQGSRQAASTAGRMAIQAGARIAASAAGSLAVEAAAVGAVVTMAVVAPYSVYLNETMTDQELGQVRREDNAWGRFLDGDTFFDGMDDALFGAD